MKKYSVGVIGLAVMGKNLALNIAEKGFSVAVYNRTYEKTREIMADYPCAELAGFETLPEFIDSLEKPRKIILMVKAGSPVDQNIELLIPHLEPGDLIMDGGNSFFIDTRRRAAYLQEKGILYLGTGISGGEEGARHGPAIMPGGDEAAYRLVEPILTKISAHVGQDPCCAFIGPDGAGHYVKMVHNGIEYGDMQLIAEAYFLLREILGLSAAELHDVFAGWNRGELDSYLIEITADIFSKTDPETGKPLVDVIKDAAGQKGTGKWTSQNALDLGVAAPTIAEAVFARCLSALKTERVAASSQIRGPEIQFGGDRAAFIEAVRRALYASKICSYAQGFSLLKAASEEYGWNLNLGTIAMIFRGGCIIRAQFLNQIRDAFATDLGLKNLMLADYFKTTLENYQDAWREVVATAARHGVAVPAFASALSYFDSYRTAALPANLIQAQRDYFGAHTYERVDQEGTFHFQWI
jgi:6-phosphogluconate dehydrogenase